MKAKKLEGLKASQDTTGPKVAPNIVTKIDSEIS
jgi:hypothetical protein